MRRHRHKGARGIALGSGYTRDSEVGHKLAISNNWKIIVRVKRGGAILSDLDDRPAKRDGSGVKAQPLY